MLSWVCGAFEGTSPIETASKRLPLMYFEHLRKRKHTVLQSVEIQPARISPEEEIHPL